MRNSNSNPTSSVTVTVTLENGKQIQLSGVDYALEQFIQNLSKKLPGEELNSIIADMRDMLVENAKASENSITTVQNGYALLNLLEFFFKDLSLNQVPYSKNDNV